MVSCVFGFASSKSKQDFREDFHRCWFRISARHTKDKELPVKTYQESDGKQPHRNETSMKYYLARAGGRKNQNMSSNSL